MSAPGETRRGPSRKLILALVAFLGAPTALLFRQAWVSRIRADVTGLSPPGWIGTSGPAEFMVFDDRPELIIRRGVSAPWVHPVSPVTAEEVRYLTYDPKTRSAALATPEQWDTSRGKVTLCGESGRPIVEGGAPKVQDHAIILSDGNSEVKLNGNLAISSLTDPTGRLRLYLTARDDRWFKRGWPGLVGGVHKESSYQHFHQVVDLARFEPLGPSLRLPIVSGIRSVDATPEKDRLDYIGWSADSRFVIYIGRTSFIVIAVER